MALETNLRLRRRFTRAFSRALLSRTALERFGRFRSSDAGRGYDVFGMHRDWLMAARALGGPLYRHYFRVTAHDAEVLPSRGAAILVANHAGTLPLDAALLALDVYEHTEPPRVPRCIVDHFVPGLPFIGSLFSRLGAVSGTQSNVRHLLEAGELCLIFPEGLAGISKPFRERYRLQGWQVGHAELALRHGVPVIPIAVIGSEEQWPALARIERVQLFGAPYLPIPATPLPLPVHYHIHYGAPIDLRASCGSSTHLATEAIARAAAQTRAAVESLIAGALASRQGVFR